MDKFRIIYIVLFLVVVLLSFIAKMDFVDYKTKTLLIGVQIGILSSIAVISVIYII